MCERGAPGPRGLRLHEGLPVRAHPARQPHPAHLRGECAARQALGPAPLCCGPQSLVVLAPGRRAQAGWRVLSLDRPQVSAWEAGVQPPVPIPGDEAAGRVTPRAFPGASDVGSSQAGSREERALGPQSRLWGATGLVVQPG